MITLLHFVPHIYQLFTYSLNEGAKRQINLSPESRVMVQRPQMT